MRRSRYFGVLLLLTAPSFAACGGAGSRSTGDAGITGSSSGSGTTSGIERCNPNVLACGSSTAGATGGGQSSTGRGETSTGAGANGGSSGSAEGTGTGGGTSSGSTGSAVATGTSTGAVSTGTTGGCAGYSSDCSSAQCCSGPACDSSENTCLLADGGNCNDGSLLCANGELCDGDVCSPPGPCLNYDQSCGPAAGAVCCSGLACASDVCLVALGSPCSESESQCADGATCTDAGVCEQSCVGYQDDCTENPCCAGLACDSTSSWCLIAGGYPCDPSNQSCANQYVCTYTGPGTYFCE